ncbi:cAMP-mediated signaling protein sok1 [Coemansia sp. RSA 2708]|nr:cAMP-mediated signaling protein sok1 [Coemansia sp. RSA 2708]
MTESYAAQDNEYLTTHRAQAATPSGNSPVTPSFMPSSSSGGSQSAVAAVDSTAAGRPGASVAGSASTAAPTPAPCVSGVGSTNPVPTSAPAEMSIASPTESTATSLPNSAGLAQGRRSRGHRKNSSSSGALMFPCVSRPVVAHAGTVARGIKRRGSDSCIVLMAVSSSGRISPSVDRTRGHPRKRRSLEAPASATGQQQRSAGFAAPSPASSAAESGAPRSSAAPDTCPADDGRTANMRKSHGLPTTRDPARRNGSRARAASLSPTMRTRAVPRRLPIAGATAPADTASSADIRGSACTPVSAAPLSAPTRLSSAATAATAAVSRQAVPSGVAAAGPIAPAPTATRSQTCALPPVNRYTLRELKIHNILQNPRLRHEVLFEPKLEFRPNSSGQLAEAKQRAAMQYWAVVEYEVKAVMASPTASNVATVTMLIIELREILAEMCEDSPKSEQLSQHAVDLRERIDEDCVRQQLEHGVFDAAAVMAYLASVMRVHAQPSRQSAIARLSVYIQRGRLARALRGAFDVLEAIKIDTANSSIDMYREYMRSTAVAFERSHFNMALRRQTIALEDTTVWWRRALDEARAQERQKLGLDAVFYAAARELVLDDSQPVPALFRMDDGRIQTIRRETERLAIIGMVFLAFSQFLQLVGRSVPSRSVAAEFAGANGRLNYERLAAECLQLVPEGCGVQWAESLTGNRASSSKGGARGDVGFSQLVDDLVVLAERVFGRVLAASEVAMLERTLLRAARHECPLREVVEDRVGSAICEHTNALSALNGKVRGTECEAMPASAQESLRRSMLSFLVPGLTAVSGKIHTVVTHHWHVYKAFYAAVSSSAARSKHARANGGSGRDGDSSAGSNNGETARSATSSTSSSANTISAR